MGTGNPTVPGEFDTPIELNMPAGLVSENAFRWPGEPFSRGGMAVIFDGEDKRLRRQVILKAPLQDADQPANLTRLLEQRIAAEAKILAKLQHPSIVTIYELGRATTGFPFCVMEKVAGTSLRDRLDEIAVAEKVDGKRDERARLELVSSLVAIAEAMGYAHERRVIHRDINPNNILLGARGEATLIDWGIARDLDAPATVDLDEAMSAAASQSGRMVTINAGTPPYVPLEQTQGRKPDPSFDVYSFGITLYEVVSGKTPFEYEHLDDPAARQRQLMRFLSWVEDPPAVPPASARDPELSGIIARAIDPRHEQRFTADELVTALKQYLTGDLVFSHRYSLTGRLSRWVRRNKTITVTLMFLAISAVAAALIWAQLSRQAREKAELRLAAATAREAAAEKAAAAELAANEAAAAKLRAEQAEREGRDAQELRSEAERKRRAADALRSDAEAAARQARGTAAEALARSEEAMKAKAAADAERARAEAAANAAGTQAQQAEAAAMTARLDKQRADEQARNAVTERETARTVAAQAEAHRDAARAAQAQAEAERDRAIGERVAIERERDALRVASKDALDQQARRIAELEARVRELEALGGPANRP